MSDSAPAPDPNADDAGEQSFLSHLVELRARLVKAVAAWAVASAAPLKMLSARMRVWRTAPVTSHWRVSASVSCR